MCDVFLSLASEDEKKGLFLKSELEKIYGIGVFLHTLSAQKRNNWPEKIKKELKKCSFILLIGTVNTHDKKEVLAEICQYPEKVIILNYGDLKISELPAQFHTYEWIPFSDPYGFIVLEDTMSLTNPYIYTIRYLKNLDRINEDKIFLCKEYNKLQESLYIERAILNQKCLNTDNYEQVFQYLKIGLWKSSYSHHIMSITPEAIRNFYGDESKDRGGGWWQEQDKWIKENKYNKNSIKRIAIIRNFESYLNNPNQLDELIKLLKFINERCDLQIYIEENMQKLDSFLVPRDFGIFFNEKPTLSLFTFVSIFAGKNFTKFSGDEFISEDPGLVDILNNYFKSLWDNKLLTHASTAFKNQYLDT